MFIFGLHRRWIASVVALMAVGVACRIAICRYQYNAAESDGARGWLGSAVDQRLPAVHRMLFDQLERGGGDFTAELDGAGRLRSSGEPRCFDALADLAQPIRRGDRRFVIACGRSAAAVVAKPLDAGATRFHGRLLDAKYVAELANLASADVVLRDAEGELVSTVRDAQGRPAQIALPSALEEKLLRGERIFASTPVRAGSERRYLMGAPLPDGAPSSLLRVLFVARPETLPDGGPLFRLQVFVAFALALIVGGALLWSLRRLTAPWLHMQDATARVAAGDFGVELPERGSTETAQVAASFNRMMRRLRDANSRMLSVEKLASVGTLAAGVAHEINNPLSFVQANLEYLEAELPGLIDAAARERLLPALTDAMEGASRVRAIVRDMRLFSGKADDGRQRVDVRRVLESSIHLANNQIRHVARLVQDFGEVPEVMASAQRLGQVFLNLLVNAAQAIKRGGAADDVIQVRTRFERGRVVVEVTDTGEGIPPENLTRLFDPFFTTKPVGEGTGLGLSICHGIISALGGTIEVESKLGAGSAFRVLLPPAPAVPVAIPAEPQREPATDPRAEPVPLAARPAA